MKKPAKVSEFLEDALSSLGLSSVGWMVRIRSGWPGIVGPILSGNSFPARLKNGLLTVLVRDHSWAQELQLKKPLLIRGIAELLGEERVREIRFVTGPLPRAESEEAVPQVEFPSADRSVPDPEGLSRIGDPETREILRSISRKSSSRRRSKILP